MALTKLTSNLIEGGTGTDWVTAIQTSNFTAEAGKGYFVNTTSQTLYVNLPVGVVGMEITIQDYAGTFGTNKVILNANGSEKIQGSALEGKITTNNATAVLIYQDATKGWTSQDVKLNVTEISWATPTGQSLTYSTPSPQSSSGTAAATFPTTTFTATLAGYIISGTATIAGLPSGITAAQTITGSGAGNTLTVTLTGTFPSTDYVNTALTLSGLTVLLPLTVDYLVVGGGAGATNDISGGGGAGGLRTSYGSTSGGGGSAESSLSLIAATNYTVTVGSGGSGIASSGGSALNGSNSVFSTITSIGGGGGHRLGNGATGGSGGGIGRGNSGSYTPGSGTADQGYAGGPDTGAVAGTGGGGASAIGGNSSGGGNPSQGGAGGDGLAVSITGLSVTYSGGGGGGGYYGTGGSGGSGGGGNGGTGNAQNNATNGTANTGGGAGGGEQNASAARNGGSGIVILRYPSSYTISGLSGTTTTVGTDKVTTFTAGTGNIQFN
jgi:hypothetical protein